MKNEKSKPLLSSSSLSDLIEKFSQEDVIAVMEKEYQSSPNQLIPIGMIDDTSFVKDVKVPEEVVDYFAAGLKEKGFYNPLVVRPIVGDRYELILGRKRFLGAKKAGLLSIPCAIREVGDEEELLMLLADTRDQRDTNVVEMALVYDALQKKFGYTQQTLASLSHLSRSQITNNLRILRLPRYVRDEICLGKLSYGHAKAIVSLPEAEIDDMVSLIHEKKLSVRETENLVSERLRPSGAPTVEGLKKQFGADSVSETHNSVTFSFASEEEKIAFLEKIKG